MDAFTGAVQGGDMITFICKMAFISLSLTLFLLGYIPLKTHVIVMAIVIFAGVIG